MKINLAKSAGFCFGVKRALEIAFKTASLGGRVYMLSDIVHNEDVIKEIKRIRIMKIRKFNSGKGKILLIPAHGVGIKTIDKARNLGYKIVDATCPMVKEIHKIARNMEGRGYKIIVIGDKEHDEVRGIVGQLKKKAIVIEDLGDIPSFKINKAALIVQSTQNFEKVRRIVDALKPRISDLEFFNTICRPTLIKQEEIKKMPLENEVMLIVGSKNSANTKRLYEISKFLNPRSFWVQSRRDVKLSWLKGIKNAGVAAGASTPDNVIKEVIEYIKNAG